MIVFVTGPSRKRSLGKVTGDTEDDVTEHTITNAPNSVIVPRNSDIDGNTSTSDLASQSSSRVQKTGESIIIADWVQKGLFKFCKFVTSQEDMEYGQPLSLFAFEENNIVNQKQKWWYDHKKGIVKTLKEKRNCVVDSLKNIFKSKWNVYV